MIYRGRMRLENAFTVPAPVDQAWSVLLDVERVAPCLPGAALDGGGGSEFTGTMTIKLGPVTSRYGGTVRVEEADEAARRAVLLARARDTRGDGSASATITTQLEPDGDGTRVLVVTELQITGAAAQFGRGVMQDVSGKLMRQFADCLAEEIGEGAARPAAGAVAPPERASAMPAAATSIAYEETRVGRLPLGPAGDAALAAAQPVGEAPAAPSARRRRSAEVLDLGAASRGALAKRAVPVMLALGAAAAITIRLARRR
jgi:carbon monoxide dehydrogenase subunit G